MSLEEEINWISSDISDLQLIDWKQIQIDKCLRLVLHYNKLHNLRGLPVFNNLTELNISSNYIESCNLPELAYLPNLKSLDLSGNLISSLDGLPRLPTLTVLSIAFNKIDNLEGIEFSAPNIEGLDVRANKITMGGKLVVLTKLINLQAIQLAQNKICEKPANVIWLFSECKSLKSIDNKSMNDWKDIQLATVDTPAFDRLAEKYFHRPTPTTPIQAAIARVHTPASTARKVDLATLTSGSKLSPTRHSTQTRSRNLTSHNPWNDPPPASAMHETSSSPKFDHRSKKTQQQPVQEYSSRSYHPQHTIPRYDPEPYIFEEEEDEHTADISSSYDHVVYDDSSSIDVRYVRQVEDDDIDLSSHASTTIATVESRSAPPPLLRTTKQQPSTLQQQTKSAQPKQRQPVQATVPIPVPPPPPQHGIEPIDSIRVPKTNVDEIEAAKADWKSQIASSKEYDRKLLHQKQEYGQLHQRFLSLEVAYQQLQDQMEQQQRQQQEQRMKANTIAETATVADMAEKILEIESLREQLEAQNTRVGELTQKLQAAAQNKSIGEETTRLALMEKNGELLELHNILKNKSQEIDESQAQLVTARDEVQLLKQQMASHKEYRDVKEQEVIVYQERLAYNDSLIKTLQYEVILHKQQITTLEAQTKLSKEDIGQKHDQYQQQLRDIQDKLSTKEIKLQELQESLQQKSSELAISKQEINIKDNQLTTLVQEKTQEKTQLLKEIQELRGEKELLDESCKQAQHKQTKYEKRLQKLMTGFDEISANNEKLQKKLQHAERLHEKDTKHIQELCKCVYQLQEIIDYRQDETQKLKEQKELDEYEASRKVCQQCISLQMELSTTQQQLNTAQHSIEQLRDDYDQKVQSLAKEQYEKSLQSQIKETVINDQLQEISKLKQQIMDSQVDKFQFQHSLHGQEMKLQEYENMFQMYELQLEKKQKIEKRLKKIIAEYLATTEQPEVEHTIAGKKSTKTKKKKSSREEVDEDENEDSEDDEEGEENDEDDEVEEARRSLKEAIRVSLEGEESGMSETEEEDDTEADEDPDRSIEELDSIRNGYHVQDSYPPETEKRKKKSKKKKEKTFSLEKDDNFLQILDTIEGIAIPKAPLPPPASSTSTKKKKKEIVEEDNSSVVPPSTVSKKKKRSNSTSVGSTTGKCENIECQTTIATLQQQVKLSQEETESLKAKYHEELLHKQQECEAIANALTRLEEKSKALADDMIAEKQRYEGIILGYKADKKKLHKLCKLLEQEIEKKEQELGQCKQAADELQRAFHQYSKLTTPSK